MIDDEQNRRLFLELAPGDRVRLTHRVRVGDRQWTSQTSGTVVRIARQRHGLHFRRNSDDAVFSDLIVLRRDDGELTTVTLDEFSDLTRLAKAEPGQAAPGQQAPGQQAPGQAEPANAEPANAESANAQSAKG